MFPEQQQNDFYAFGESYGGKYAPQLAYKIHQENQNLDGEKIKINLGNFHVYIRIKNMLKQSRKSESTWLHRCLIIKNKSMSHSILSLTFMIQMMTFFSWNRDWEWLDEP